MKKKESPKKDGPSPAKRRRTRATPTVTSASDLKGHDGRTPQNPQVEPTTPQKAIQSNADEITPVRKGEPRLDTQSPDRVSDEDEGIDSLETSQIVSQTEQAQNESTAQSPRKESEPIGIPQTPTDNAEMGTLDNTTTACQPRPVTEVDDCVLAAATANEITHVALLEGLLDDAVISVDELGQDGVLHSSGECQSPITPQSSHNVNVTISVAELGGAVAISQLKDVVPDVPEEPTAVYTRASVDGEILCVHREGEFVPGKKTYGDQGSKLLMKENILVALESQEQAPILDKQ